MTVSTMTDRLRDDRGLRGRAWVLTVCVLAGVGFLVIGLGNGMVWFGLGGLAVMLGYGVLLTLTRRRSETISLLAGEVSDERQAQITTTAMALTGHVWMALILGGFLVGAATDAAYTNVFSGLAAIGGLTFAISLFVLSRRG